MAWCEKEGFGSAVPLFPTADIDFIHDHERGIGIKVVPIAKSKGHEIINDSGRVANIL
jgi:hypothetical protein